MACMLCSENTYAYASSSHFKRDFHISQLFIILSLFISEKFTSDLDSGSSCLKQYVSGEQQVSLLTT